MTENTMSASHFRVHLKEIANSVRLGEQAVTVERHGSAMFAVVSLEDLEFLRKHKYGAAKEAAPERKEQAPPQAIDLIDPKFMPIEMVEKTYESTHGTTDWELMSWRYRAYYAIYEARGKLPERDWRPPSTSGS